jgi:glycerol-3-phosphate acyltransferase PlsY
MKIVFIVREDASGRRTLQSPHLTETVFEPMPATLAIVAGAYLIGSISFAVVVSRAFGLPDPRDYGSKNPGATNVLRTGNRHAALLTLAGDGVKGFVAVALARWLAPMLDAADWTVAAAALAVFVGHLYPVFHRFAGGKGVATAAGIVFALQWPLGLALTVVWLTMAFGFKISSLAALTTAVLLPLGMFYATGPGAYAWISVVIALLLFWRHRDNIRQLLSGSERSIGR